MPIHNTEIAELFNRIADLLEIEGANPFRIRAYQQAALLISNSPQPLSDLVAQGQPLEQLPGIGKDLASKIQEIIQTGELQFLKELEARIPAELLQMLKFPGLGPKRVRALWQELSLTTLEALHLAAQQGQIHQLPGFGPKIEEQILKEFKRRQSSPTRILWSEAEPKVEDLLAYLKQCSNIQTVLPAGSFRRGKETIGDLDLLAISTQPQRCLDYFVQWQDISRVVSQGGTRSTVILRSGLQVDLRVVKPESLGAAWHYFTGSQAHNIAIRKLGIRKKLKINEYGVFQGSRRLAGKTEKEIYQQVGLAYIEPELRENLGELEAARKGQLPHLVTAADICGDLHTHTSETDGYASLEEMALAAQARGYEYLGITDHSQHVTVAHGLDTKRLAKQIQDIDRLNAKLKGITLLKGIEVDILENGQLDLPDTILHELDFVVGSIHYKFNLTEEKQTERIVRAMDNSYFNILGHPTGRLLTEREPYAVNLEVVLQAAKARGCFVELNAHPTRLDLNDINCRRAQEQGVWVVISTDAHSVTTLENIRYGIQQARRGWLEAKDVLNTRPLKEIRKWLRRK